MGSPSLSVARLAVDVLIWSIASNYRVKCLGAIMTLVAFAVPITALGNYQFSGKHHAATSGASSARLRLNLGRVRGGGLRGQRTAKIVLIPPPISSVKS